MELLWCVLLASVCLASDNKNSFENKSTGNLRQCPSLKKVLVPMSLGPYDNADIDRVHHDCKVPMQNDGYLWHQVKVGLWFQATGSLEVEDDKYTVLSNQLECDPESLSCTLAVSNIVGVTASETWGTRSSSTVGLSVKLLQILTIQASNTEGSSHSRTSSTSTSTTTSYSCSIPGNHTVYLAARIQYYLVFGYVAEWMIVRREFYIDGNGQMRERDYWGWDRSCQPMFRIPKVQADGSIAGTRRCVVQPYPGCASSPTVNPQPPIVTIL